MGILTDEYVEGVLDGSIDLAVEDIDLPALQKELEITLQTFPLLEERLDKAIHLHQQMTEEGVSRIGMESMQTLISDPLLSEEVPLESFTVRPSSVNQEYSQEAFATALASISKETILFVVKLIVGIISAILGIMKIFQTHQEMSSKKEKAAGVKTEKEYEDLRREYEEKVNAHADTLSADDLGVTLKAKEYEAKIKSEFSTELHRRVLQRHKGKALHEALASFKGWLDYLGEGFGEMESIHDLIRDSILDGDHGQDLTEKLTELKRIILEGTRIRTASHTMDYALTQAYNRGIPRLAPEELKYFMEEHNADVEEKWDSDTFWKPYYETKRGAQADRIRYIPIYSEGDDRQSSQGWVFSLNSWPAADVHRFRKEYKRMQRDGDGIVRDAQKLAKEMEKMTKNYQRWIKERDKRVNRDPNFEADRVVWPIYDRETGLRAGDIRPESKVQGTFFVTAAFPRTLLGAQGLHKQYIAGIMNIQRVLNDIGKLVETNFEVYDAHYVYSYYMHDDLKRLEKAREDYRKSQKKQ